MNLEKCLLCNKPIINTHKATNQKYCSGECRNIARGLANPKQTKKCTYCGKEFKTSVKAQVFCSHECNRLSFNQERRKERRAFSNLQKANKKCPICNSVYTAKWPSQIYCSKTCLKEAMKIKKRKILDLKTIPCQCCGKIFEQVNKKQRFCSLACHRKDANSRRDSRQTKKMGLSVKCKRCGKEFLRTYTGQQYCSDDCLRDKLNLKRQQRRTICKQLNNHNAERNSVLHGIRCLKRPFPMDGKCEICGKVALLGYHHWGEIVRGDWVTGIWVCRSNNCHSIIERPEESIRILQKFAVKKEQIDQEIENLKSQVKANKTMERHK